MEKHFELTEESKLAADGTLISRIIATKDSEHAKKGDLGGFVESLDNLTDQAWVFGTAQVFGKARVSGEAWVAGDARATISPVFITGFLYLVTITDTHVQIGCHLFSKKYWLDSGLRYFKLRISPGDALLYMGALEGLIRIHDDLLKEKKDD